MKSSLILRLSALGFVLALASIFFVSPNLEPVLWFAVFLYSAYAIGNGTRTLRFVHGLCLGILNSLWIVGTHDLFLARYLAGHPREVAMIDMTQKAGLALSPRVIMSFTGTMLGVLEGIVIGVFAVVAGLMVTPRSLDLSADIDMLELGTEA